MDLGLKGKAVVVSGGARGLGAGIALALAKEGALPIIVSRSRNEELEAQLGALGGYRFYEFNLRNYQEIEGLCKEILKEYPDIYGLVNNAGVNDNLPIETTPVDRLIESYKDNLFHYYELTRCLLPSLKRNKGSILNIVSKVALTGQGSTSAYASAKAAQVGWTREWACAFAKDGVRVNALAPAEVLTPLYKRWLDNFPNPDEKYQAIASKIPLGKRFSSIEEIADMSVFVLSPRSSHTTGQLLFVDGGYVHLDRALS